MPPAKNKQKKKLKEHKLLASTAGEDKVAGFSDDIIHAESWEIAVDSFCRYLKLPGMIEFLNRQITADWHLRVVTYRHHNASRLKEGV